jgi:uncharacterized protein (DUF1015 family)
VAAVPYDVVTTDEARALVQGNPLSFLHVSRAEIDLPTKTSPYSEAVYERAAENFERLKRSAPLVIEDSPRLYVYRLRMAGHVQTGVAGCFSLDEYASGAIRKHERTRRDKEDDRTQHMLKLRAQTGPVFLTHRASGDLDRLIAPAATAAPMFDFEAADGVRHTVWQLSDRVGSAVANTFQAIEALYIADGHHRAASAARVRQLLSEAGGYTGEADTFLGVAFPDSEVQILPYNRVVKDLGSRTPAALLAELKKRFTVTDGQPGPKRRGDVAMFLAGRWHTIVLNSTQGDLDVTRLQEGILGPLLGIGDERTDRRIDFVGGARGAGALENLVNSGSAAVAFSMWPVSVDDLMRISDRGEIMPPKSTWFEPKLRDGLLSHVI